MKAEERKTFLNVKLRNLKRKVAKMKEHAALTDEILELKSEIDSIEKELKLM